MKADKTTLIQFLRTTGTNSPQLKKIFETYFNFEKKEGAYSSDFYYEFPDPKSDTMNVFFSKENKHKDQNFKKHKNRAVKEKKCKFTIFTLDWKLDPLQSFLFICEIANIKDGFFEIKILATA